MKKLLLLCLIFLFACEEKETTFIDYKDLNLMLVKKEFVKNEASFCKSTFTRINGWAHEALQKTMLSLEFSPLPKNVTESLESRIIYCIVNKIDQLEESCGKDKNSLLFEPVSSQKKCLNKLIKIEKKLSQKRLKIEEKCIKKASKAETQSAYKDMLRNCMELNYK